MSYSLCVVIAIFGLGMAVGSAISDFEQWSFGSTLAVSRIVGMAIFFLFGIIAVILR